MREASGIRTMRKENDLVQRGRVVAAYMTGYSGRTSQWQGR